MVNPIRSIRAYNAGRDPERLAIKFKAMRQDAFVFLRGACHLFYERLPEVSGAGVLRRAPLTWVCGDLHLQNFGSYKGDNRLVYFDINDFDEGALAPCTWDLVRFLTSVLVGGKTLGVKPAQACRCRHRRRSLHCRQVCPRDTKRDPQYAWSGSHSL